MAIGLLKKKQLLFYVGSIMPITHHTLQFIQPNFKIQFTTIMYERFLLSFLILNCIYCVLSVVNSTNMLCYAVSEIYNNLLQAP